MEQNTDFSQVHDPHRVVFIRIEYDAEKIGLICDRDRLFQQYITYLNSIEKWQAKEIVSDNVDERYNQKRNKSRIVSHLQSQLDEIKTELLRLDSLISPFELLPLTTEKIAEACSDI